MFRSVLLLLLLLFAVAAPASLAATATDLRILHRVFHPSLPILPFTHRATLRLHPQPSLVPADSFQDDLLQYASAVDGLDHAIYQLALEHPDDTNQTHADDTRWATSSVLACHLPATTSDAITVHLDPDGNPFALDYFLSPVPHNGACPSYATNHPPSGRALLANTTVVLRSPTFPPLPALRLPPPVTAEGKPVQAAREKSFIEKYWVYMVVALVAMTLAPAPAEEGEGQGSGGRK